MSTGTPPSSRSRDAALRRLARCNRWLLAGSATLTGAFTLLAAQAFPGKTRAAVAKGTKSNGKASRSTHVATHRVGHAKALKAPAQAPAATTQSSSTQASEASSPSSESTSTESTSTQATPETQSQTATTEQATPVETETAKTTETQASSVGESSSSSSSSESSTPVVSGGS